MLGKGAEVGIYDENLNLLPCYRKDELKPTTVFSKSKEIFEMKVISEKISKAFPHARIDLYYNDNKIIFGEITFYDGSGYMAFEPDEFDYVLGNKFVLTERMEV